MPEGMNDHWSTRRSVRPGADVITRGAGGRDRCHVAIVELSLEVPGGRTGVSRPRGSVTHIAVVISSTHELPRCLGRGARRSVQMNSSLLAFLGDRHRGVIRDTGVGRRANLTLDSCKRMLSVALQDAVVDMAVAACRTGEGLETVRALDHRRRPVNVHNVLRHRFGLLLTMLAHARERAVHHLVAIGRPAVRRSHVAV
jgi:hypothetical protein